MVDSGKWSFFYRFKQRMRCSIFCNSYLSGAGQQQCWVQRCTCNEGYRQLSRWKNDGTMMDWAPWILKKIKKNGTMMDRAPWILWVIGLVLRHLENPVGQPAAQSHLSTLSFKSRWEIVLFQCVCCKNFNFIFYHCFKNWLHLWQPQYRSWKVNVYKKGWMFTQTVHHRRPSRSGCFKRKLLRKGAVFIRLLIVVKIWIKICSCPL